MTMFRSVLFAAVGCLLLAFVAGHAIDNNRVRSCRGVEYPGFGCFDNRPPFNNTRWLPQSPAFIGTVFLLYTREIPETPDMLLLDQSSSIQRSHFNAQNPTKILVHGFLQHRNHIYLINTTKALLEEGPMNVIVVGWSGGAGFPYGQAVANTRLVGAQIAKLVTALTSQTRTSLSQVHIVGHSLGAHVAGYAGALLPGLGRITGLDPAQPSYRGFDPSVRLDPTDATLVDIIHTDGVLYNTVNGYGMIEPVGHIDFYPNGGASQPGCHDESSILNFVEDVFRDGVSTAESGLSCSHERSTSLFLASIDRGRSCHFTAFPCASEESFLRGECTSCGNIPCPVMGLHLGIYTRARGVFHLNTTDSEPFCGHHHFVTLTLGDSMPEADGNLQVKIAGERGEIDWTEVKRGELIPGAELPKLVLSQSVIGDVVSVDVMFTQNTGYLSYWGSDRVMLRSVKVASPMQSRPKYYCPPDTVLRTSQPMTLTGGSYTEADCQ